MRAGHGRFKKNGVNGRVNPLVTDVPREDEFTPVIAKPATMDELRAAIETEPRDSFDLWEAEFELWFWEQFNQKPRRQIAGYADSQVIVANRHPIQPLPWVSLSDGVLRLIEGPVYLIGDARRRPAAWDATIVQVAEQIIGAPLETIHPNNQPDE